MSYIVLPRDRIGELMRGELTELPVTLSADVDSLIAVRVSHDRRPTCWLRVIACEADLEGYWLTVRPAPREHEPRLLMAGSPLTGGGKARILSPRKRKFRSPKAKPPGGAFTDRQASGYTATPILALKGEPEGIDLEDLNVRWHFRSERKHGEALGERDEARRQARQLLDTEERMRRAREAAALNYIDVRDELKALRHMQRVGRGDATTAQLERIERIAYRDAA